MGESKRQEAETESLIGATIAGRYKIVSLIARGGMGKVFRAEQSALGRICALKVLSPNYEGDKDPEFHRRFSLEAETAAKLQHPNTVTIFDYGKCDDPEIYYIAMEYLDGRTLHRVLHEERTIAEPRASHIAQQICRSVAEAHRLGVVHRDLKPSNVLLVERGDDPDFVKVLDFGLVKDVSGKGEDLTQTGLFMGSPKYMAPEQVLGGEISARTDVYALGVMLYEMICGKVPFDRKAGMSTLIAHVNEKPPPLTERDANLAVTPEMDSIVMRCLEKDPARRYASMKDLLAALKRAGGDLTETSESLPRARIPLEALRPAATPIPGAEGLSSRAKGSTPPPSGTMRSPIALSPASAQPPAPPPPSPSGPSGPVAGLGADSLSPPSQVSRTFTGDRAPAPGWRPYVLAVVTSVIGAGTAALVLARHNDGGGPKASESAAPSVVVAVALPVSAEPPRGPGLRIVTVESEPSGAGVSELGVEVCMATPCRVYWTGDSAASEHKLNLFKKGYRSSTLVVAPGQDKVLGKLELPPAGEAPPPPPVVVRATATATAEAAPVPPVTVAATVATPAPSPTPAPTPVAPDPVVAQPTVAAVVPDPVHSDEPIIPPTRVSAPPPAYSREALEAKVSGTVVAKCQITVAGSTSGCRIIKGIPFMDGPVLSALAGWKFNPATQGGKPVPMDQVLTIKMAPH
jgi:serine/threonine-protein kinase